ncbi:hypothetical protein B0A52_04185 [Exophiala mesophila]|uniref:CDP-diacylglycerol-glycerol-3-phosphate 3-phosphatidyltransferase n=1 Tax=Exophiala mesophila TaxID=212818 RepID=A0A438N879_EXOME|nr:hypothetical protein B0A52_04185 [Exophiala mesophila]
MRISHRSLRLVEESSFRYGSSSARSWSSSTASVSVLNSLPVRSRQPATSLWRRAPKCLPLQRTKSSSVRFASSGSGSSSEDPVKAATKEKSSLAPSKILQKLPKLAPTTHENIYTLPNFLTFTRLLAAPAVGYFVINSQPIVALSLFFYAGVTDAVDGYLARRYNSQTVVGTVIDPMADKALMTIAVVSLTVQGILPLWVSVIILGRDVALAISAIYFRWISLPPPKTFSRYWDFSLPSAEVHPTEISKINTFLQLLLVGNAMLLPVLPTTLVETWNLVGVFEGWCGLVATTTIWSGLSYIGNKDAVKILSKEESERRQKNGLEDRSNKS